MTSSELRSLSSLLYGNAYRLEVAAAIGRMEGKPVSARAVTDESGLEYNRTQEQIAHFVKAGLLIPDHDPQLRRKDYRPVELSYWTAAARLLAELQETEELS